MIVKISKLRGMTRADFHFDIEETLKTYKNRLSISHQDNIDNYFIEYKLDKESSSEKNLVFRNVNHLKMLHKYLISSYFYFALIALPFLVFFFDKLKYFDNEYGEERHYLLPIIVVLAILFFTIKDMEVPYKLVFDHAIIYEKNHINRKMNLFFPNGIVSTYFNGNECVTISSEDLSIFIMEKKRYELIDFMKSYFRKFHFENHL